MATLSHPAVSHSGASRSTRRSYLARSWPLYIMILPALTVLAIFHYYPMYGAVIAFQDYNPGLGFANSPWVGLQNFQTLFLLPDFSRVLVNTVWIAVAKIISVQACAILLSLLLNEARSFFFRRSIQTLIYLPYFLSWIVLGGIVIDLLSATGIVNQLLGRVGGSPPILFLGSNEHFVPTLITTNLWKEVGFATIVYLAALTSVDPELHEAAAIDGANRFQRILHVTLPGIVSTVALLAALNLGNVLQAGFEQVLTLYNPGVYRTGDILDTYIYRMGLISARYSLAGAVGLFKSVIGFVLIVVAYRLANRFANFRMF